MSHNHDGYDYDELDEIITLIDEDDNEHVFTVLEYLEIDEQVYVVVTPQDDPNEHAFVFKVMVDENGDEFVMDIEDDEEFARVAEVLESDELD
ncbi:MAG: DUF1292 domain-containing protein [Bacillota bacterium]|jgi:uncharacterized protein YrzB (UPF0473 family)|nr:DUF1292 domain-containing protein [Bacillota bacterium]NLJ02735.1 DUF1292 domain-containing protein [Bacillota bacterium]